MFDFVIGLIYNFCMIDSLLREKVGYDPEELFRRSQIAYRKAYKRGEAPSWSKHPLPEATGEFVDRLKVLTPKPKILDIGCGDGNKSEKLAELGLEVVGVDHEHEAIEKALQRRSFRRIENDLGFLQGDARKLDQLFPENNFDGIFDYQCMACIPPEFWGDVTRGYNQIIRPKGLLLIDLLNAESREFYGDVTQQMGNGHEYVFQYNPSNPLHQGLDWEDGLYVYFFDGNETETVFGDYFNLLLLQKRIHPYNEKRILWSALMESKKQ